MNLRAQVTGKPAINYISDDDSLLYVLYASCSCSCSFGYRAGACNARAFLDPAELHNVVPEELDSYEVGIMHELFDNRNARGCPHKAMLIREY